MYDKIEALAPCRHLWQSDLQIISRRQRQVLVKDGKGIVQVLKRHICLSLVGGLLQLILQLVDELANLLQCLRTKA